MIPAHDDFWFLPLGGVGEIGMNMALYGHDEQWLMVDCGVTFRDPDGTNPVSVAVLGRSKSVSEAGIATPSSRFAR